MTPPPSSVVHPLTVSPPVPPDHAAPGLPERFDSIPPYGAVFGVVSDFDGVTFHLSTPKSKTKILISINVKCFKELVQYGAEEVLKREYGPYIVSPEPGYDFSVQIDLEDLPTEQEARDELVLKLALLKRNAMAAPFERAFDEFNKLAEEASQYTSESAPQGVKEGGEVMSIHYREEEAIYIKANWDRVTVIFSTEFVDARRRVATLQNAPQVLFRNDPPLELQGVPGLQSASEGAISYRRYDSISHIQTFRDYFHYHIKASKRERKTASGRTFRVQG
ncbi:hypothetical protein N7468_004284 [Penicillium chermesinum]|uniref:Arp2/3 complex 34 kDa subunit n=1 Tax=Penicillium chermesinum TaxID=63820 RepID=A0A9W9TSE8_9EURO|nr:uncharacterized protein N7468_004284 [Penicillium chermesinum]KAJ5239665.1 hypothetical protein N7468_004284 [Penicillium chermesinum]